MSATETLLNSARKHLAVFEEAWQADNDEAMDGRDFESFLEEGVMTFRLMDQLRQARREKVFRGLKEANPTLDEVEKDFYVRWLRLADAVAEKLASFETRFGRVEGADRLRACRDKARGLLVRWVPAVPASAVGSRVLDFAEEDADQIRALLDSPAGAPGRPTRPPHSVPTGDPSLLG